MKICHACKKELQIGREAGRRDECPACGADIHCCLNCAHRDPAVSKQCREPAAELVKEKGRANYCDFFSFSETKTAADGGNAESAARKTLDDLFKK
jgi:hypothetical protein